VKGLSVTAVEGLPLFAAGDDLAAVVGDAIAGQGGLSEGDVVVFAQKVVSKVEGRTVALAQVRPGERARQVADQCQKPAELVELALAEAQELMRTAPNLIIVRNRNGHVLANAGIDASNVQSGGTGEMVLLWPEDPDASAKRLREALQARFGIRIAVVISDSLGRAWRLGTMGTAIGSAGLRPIRDRRGETDLFGRVLQATLIGVADEIAAAASLVIGEATEGTPVAVVRGATYDVDETAGVGEILRPIEQDLFR
jgi:coenzyme F420-0:L-glutamate ligase / coenzyme F420-1:gamma-L-glutamate ligase